MRGTTLPQTSEVKPPAPAMKPIAPQPPRPVAAPPAQPEGGLLARFLGKKVEIRLSDGALVPCIVNTVDRYELVVTLADGSTCVVFKAAIATISEVKP